MAPRFLAELLTADVLEAQRRAYGRQYQTQSGVSADVIGPVEAAFIAARDSFYLSTVSASGWPYIQHRGGPKGFLQVLDPHTLAFADFKGNRQLVSTGNVSGNDRVALFVMDYPNRARLKILGHARVVDAQDDPALADALTTPELRRRVERMFVIDLVGLDWNCSAYITPRFTAEDVAAAAEPLRDRIAALRAELDTMKSRADLVRE